MAAGLHLLVFKPQTRSQQGSALRGLPFTAEDRGLPRSVLAPSRWLPGERQPTLTAVLNPSHTRILARLHSKHRHHTFQDGGAAVRKAPAVGRQAKAVIGKD